MCFWQIPHILQYASAVHKQLVATCGYVVSDHWPHTDTGTKAITKLKYKFWSVKEDML